MAEGDANNDQKLTKEEFATLATVWFNKLDAEKSGALSQEKFTEGLAVLLPTPQGGGPGGPGGPGGGRGGFGPATFVGPALFTVVDADKNGSITRSEWTDAFARWSTEWDTDKSGALNEEALRSGLTAVLPQPDFGGRGGGLGGPGAPGGGMDIKGVELDPLQMAGDPAKPLISKLLAVPSLRARYLGYVREIAEKHLDWKSLGAVAGKYHALIAADVKADTRKLESTEDFEKGLTESGPGGGAISLKDFADQRRAYLLRQTAPSK